jgi:hypothetical protein
MLPDQTPLTRPIVGSAVAVTNWTNLDASVETLTFQ